MNTRKNWMLCCFILFCLQTIPLPAAVTVTNIAAGDFHNLFIESDGSLWAVGMNQDGELGDHSNTSTNLPQKIVPAGVIAVSGGYSHTLFLMSDGSLWAMGKNLDGQLGDGSFNATNAPEMIEPGGVMAIAAGEEHSLFLMTNGSLWAMGYNVYGQLGDGTHNIYTNAPEQIEPGNVTAISAGFDHSLFIMSDGSLWAMGSDDTGQLGDGNSGQNAMTNLPEEIVPANVTAIAAGSDQSLFLKSDGSLWGMGNNGSGELGTGAFTTTNVFPQQLIPGNVIAIAAGFGDSMFLKSDGSLWTMGVNQDGELSNGTTVLATNTPQEIVPAIPVILDLRLSGTTLVLDAANGRSGTTYYVLTSTNLSLPTSQWTPCATNVLSTNGNFTITAPNAVNPAATQQFYLLESQ